MGSGSKRTLALLLSAAAVTTTLLCCSLPSSRFQTSARHPASPETAQVSPETSRCLANAQAQDHLASSGLPLPSAEETESYQTKLYSFLREYKYRALAWPHDKRVRDTGSYRKKGYNGSEYNGTHSAVVIYYSPEVYCWLLAGRQGAIPDGAMIIKEMYPPPAARHDGQDLSKLHTPWWAIMVRDSQATYDGWYWAGLFDTVDANGLRAAQQDPDTKTPHEYPNSGFGAYCVRCHASAEKQLTFSTLENIESGFDYLSGTTRQFGHPITFADDQSWKDDTRPPEEQQRWFIKHMPHVVHYIDHLEQEAREAKAAHDHAGVQVFPWESLDRVPQSPQGRQFLTSDQCMGCHAGDTSPFGPNFMSDGADVSPWGEWRWSMMGLAGRDPVFYAQLETETEAFKHSSGEMNSAVAADTCLRCHGVMGQRQFHLDHPNSEDGEGKPPLFSENEVFSEHSRYGALARDGISCTVCHQMTDNSKQSIMDIVTGQFSVLPRTEDGKNQIEGPFDQVKTKPMEQSLAATPAHSDFIRSSRLCASCHTIYLPVLDDAGKELKKSFEQATYLEWVNSDYRDGGKTPTSCQTCHMPDRHHDKPLEFKIANIQDKDFPQGDHEGQPLQAHGLLATEDINVTKRTRLRRHTLNGINVFSLSMFDQFNDVLGKRKDNYMSGGSSDLETTIANVAQFAKTEVAQVEVLSPQITGGQLRFQVRVTNKAGHRFPSGVGFRRAFLDVSVQDASGKVLWHSGGTDDQGRIVDGKGRVLDTEFFKDGKYQHHHQVIAADTDVQIYEELAQDADGKFTTDFLKLLTHVKDNRLLPKGWSPTPPHEDPTIDPVAIQAGAFEATLPIGEAAQDTDFTSGLGQDIVKYRIPVKRRGSLTIHAKLYYQAIPPSYLKQRFESANGPATQRLRYLASHLETAGGPIEDWKLLITEDQKSF